MAGESAREVARQAREKAERLTRRAELFEQGAVGEMETGRVLESLPPGWTVWHDLRWPGRRMANVDHVLVGPPGIFIIDTKNWTGRISLDGGVLRQNGYSREKAVAGAADSALAFAELAGPYADAVQPVLCFSGREGISGWCREVSVCCTGDLVSMLTRRPVRLTPEEVADASVRLDLATRAATSQSTPSRAPERVPAVRAPRARHNPPPGQRRRTRGPSLSRFLVGVVMLIALLSLGPQLAGAIGPVIADHLTRNLGSSHCGESAADSGLSDAAGRQGSNREC